MWYTFAGDEAVSVMRDANKSPWHGTWCTVSSVQWVSTVLEAAQRDACPTVDYQTQHQGRSSRLTFEQF
ncbi:hypothetical protein BaRGS_00002005 [Batillaria attramentaria]|uniref:Uncharacterized protein n=1 Tax=Batillaria attramentaria TaxID=370345 RepID=A0ABD0M4E3_9CAEN